MGMDLENMENIQGSELNLTEQRFDELKTYMKVTEKDPEPAYDANLDFAIESMLNRWNIPTGTKRDELKILVAKLHAKRMITPESRVIYRVLNANIDNVNVSIIQ